MSQEQNSESIDNVGDSNTGESINSQGARDNNLIKYLKQYKFLFILAILIPLSLYLFNNSKEDSNKSPENIGKIKNEAKQPTSDIEKSFKVTRKQELVLPELNIPEPPAPPVPDLPKLSTKNTSNANTQIPNAPAYPAISTTNQYSTAPTEIPGYQSSESYDSSSPRIVGSDSSASREGGAQSTGGGLDTTALLAAKSLGEVQKLIKNNSYEKKYVNENAKLNRTDASQIQATLVGNLHLVVLQGSIFKTILETPINTSSPGMVRGVVREDVYSASGNNVLIPKGTKLIGKSSATDDMINTKRINLMWERAIRPDGVDIKLSSGSTDALGRPGAPASYVDGKFKELMMQIGATSAIKIVGSTVLDAFDQGNATNTVTNITGNVNGKNNSISKTTTSTVKAGLIKDGINDAAQKTDRYVQKRINTTPVGYIEPGARVSVIVAKDLFFPPYDGQVDGYRQ